jgi:Zn finger protein HypA/HybF involved in hydrogenase expression
MERDRFPRGSIPPSSFAAIATVAPAAVGKVPAISVAAEAAIDPVKHCDLSTTCPQCDGQMQPEHAHYKCTRCGYRDSCCF